LAPLPRSTPLPYTTLFRSEAMYPDNPLTSDMLRYTRMVETVRANDALYLGSPTFRWLAAAMRAMVDAGKDSFPGQIKIPLLMLADRKSTRLNSSHVKISYA